MSTRRREDGDFDREIQAHLDHETARLIESGVAPGEARAQAARAFGNVTRARERYYERNRLVWLDQLGQDIRCGLRAIRRYPVAALVAVVSLAGGIGAMTVTLLVRDVVFHNPPPLYREPWDISRVQVGTPERPIMPLGSPVPAALYLRWRESLDLPVAAAGGSRTRDVRAGDRSSPTVIRAVTPGLFELLGVAPELGRAFSAGEAGTDGASPVVLSYRVWDRLFDRRAEAIGGTVWIDNQPFTVIGVMPRRFWFSDMNSPIWTPLDVRTLPPREGVEMVARRRAGMSETAFAARLATGLDEYAASLPPGERRLRLKTSDIGGTPLGKQIAPILPYILGASVLLTLLIACANVAILMIAQWTAREHEIAIRASIGASRRRIVRTLLTESSVIAALGGLSGIGATLLLRAWVVMRAGGAGDDQFMDLSIDPAIFVEAAAITMLTGIAAGIAPALYETRRLHANPLRTFATSDRVRQRWRNALVVAEITVTVALFVVTAAMIDGYRRVRAAELGFATRPLVSASLDNPARVAIGPALQELKQVPGIASVAAATGAPFRNSAGTAKLAVDAAGANAIVADRSAVTSGFFSTLGVSMRAGRAFSAADSPDARIVVINETAARRLFPDAAAVGHHVWIGDRPYDIVGVVADYAVQPQQAYGSFPKVFVPLPLETTSLRRVHVIIRAEREPDAFLQSLRRRAEFAGTHLESAFSFDEIRTVVGQEMLVGTAPLVPLIAIGTLLTMAGIYGVLAFAIARRSRELAVRMAIGATSGDIVRLVSTQAIRLAAAGAALGVGITFGLSRVVRAAGGAGSVFDPAPGAFVAPLVAIGVLAAAAAWAPSRRALRINPSDVLKTG